MERKVYLLISGCVDEREVLAAYSTLEAAQAALRFGDHRTTIEEFPLDAPLPSAPAGHSLWSVSVDEKELSVFRARGFEPVDKDEMASDKDFYLVHVWAVDEAEATRKGVELIEGFKAKKGLAS